MSYPNLNISNNKILQYLADIIPESSTNDMSASAEQERDVRTSALKKVGHVILVQTPHHGPVYLEYQIVLLNQHVLQIELLDRAS